MRAGKLRYRAQVWRHAEYGTSAAGTPEMTWGPFIDLRVEVIRYSVEERIRSAGGAVDDNEIIFRSRYVDGITTADRIFFGRIFHKIKAVQVLGHYTGLEIRAVEVTEEDPYLYGPPPELFKLPR